MPRRPVKSRTAVAQYGGAGHTPWPSRRNAATRPAQCKGPGRTRQPCGRRRPTAAFHWSRRFSGRALRARPRGWATVDGFGLQRQLPWPHKGLRNLGRTQARPLRVAFSQASSSGTRTLQRHQGFFLRRLVGWLAGRAAWACRWRWRRVMEAFSPQEERG